MMIFQLNSLAEDELALLLYIVNVADPITPIIEFTPNLLLSIKHEFLVKRVEKAGPLIKDEYKPLHSSLLSKLNCNWIQYVMQNEDTKNTESSEPNFQI